MKKIISILLCLVLILTSFTISSFAIGGMDPPIVLPTNPVDPSAPVITPSYPVFVDDPIVQRLLTFRNSNSLLYDYIIFATEEDGVVTYYLFLVRSITLTQHWESEDTIAVSPLLTDVIYYAYDPQIDYFVDFGEMDSVLFYLNDFTVVSNSSAFDEFPRVSQPTEDIYNKSFLIIFSAILAVLIFSVLRRFK